MLDSRPARHPLNRRKIKGDDVKAREQDAIEGARCGNEIGSTCCREHGGNHRVDCFRFDSHIIAAALLVGGGQAPVEQLLVSWRKRLLPPVLHHIEIERDPTALELGGVDGPHARLDAGFLEIARESERESLLVARRGQYFEGKGPTRPDMGQLCAFELVSGCFEQRESASQVGTVAALAIGCWRRPGAIHDVGAYRIRKRFQ